MSEPSSDYPFTVLKEGVKTVFGASVAMLITMSIGGAIPTVAGLESFSDYTFFSFCFSWIFHWVPAGLMVWGLVVAMIPAWCFYELLHGETSWWFVLAIAFVTQLSVSTLGIYIIDQTVIPWKSIAASLVTIALVVVGVIISFYRTRSGKQRDAGN